MSMSMSTVCVSVGVVSYLSDMCRDMLKDVCRRNSLDYDEECRIMNLSVGIVVVDEEVKKVSSSSPVVKVSKSHKGTFPLPFVGKESKDCCGGIKHNDGLMTQCRVVRKGTEEYCKTCQNQADKNGTNMPTYGCIKDRMLADIYDYTAPNGERVTAYSSVMLKYNLTTTMVLEEAAKMNITIDNRHFEKVEDASNTRRGRPKASKEDDSSSKGGSSSSKRGRPKKENKVIELEGSADLFATLLATSHATNAADKQVVVDKKAEVEVANKAEVEVDKKADKEARKARNAEKEVKKAEKEAKKAAKEAAAKEAAEKAAAEKEAAEKKAAAEKEAAEKKAATSNVVVEVEETSVELIIQDGKKYLKSPESGIVYDESSNEEVGEWNTKENRIDFYEDEEEEEEEYEEE